MSRTSIAAAQIKSSVELQPRKRLRICLRCQNPLPKKDRCEHCNMKFRDGFLMKVLKRILGINIK